MDLDEKVAELSFPALGAALTPGHPSFEMLVFLHGSCAGAASFIEECQALAKTARRESGEIAPSSIRCGALNNLSSDCCLRLWLRLLAKVSN